MRRMISEKSQQFIKNLSKSISTDGEGNLDVGKNLDVDGQLTINTATDLKTKDGTTIGGSAPVYIRHTVSIKYGGESYNLCFTDYNKKATAINSIQDLTTQFGNTDVAVSGTIKVSPTSSELTAVKLHIGTSATDTLVTDMVGNDHKLSDLAQYSETESYLLVEDKVTTL